MRKRLIGIVTSDKRDKTLRVEIERRYRHPRYGKIVRGRTICHVHDERNEARENDVVEIIESRPRSKTKRWDLVRIVKRGSGRIGPQVDSEPTEANEALEVGAEGASGSDAGPAAE
ncbi:MAG TPA: 30S ribosomal protein S17 [Planctomycetaceae bacterium]|nr:30S ribosomal protein S17 [Planctomycetaceae bacterium]